MTPLAHWLAIALSLALLAGYELWHTMLGRRRPLATARTAHALLRVDWVQAQAAHAGFEIVAVQTLRNSLMSATITASTAAIALMGSLSLLVSGRSVSLFGIEQLSPRLLLDLLLLAALFASYVNSAMAMRYFNHAGFAMSLPVGSAQRERHAATAMLYVKRAGLLYSWALRLFLYVAPVVIGLINVLAMPLAMLGLMAVLQVFDRAPVEGRRAGGG